MPKIKKRTSAKKKQPEKEILTIAHSLWLALEPYRKKLQIVVAVLVVVALVIGVRAISRYQMERKAMPLVTVAHEYYEPPNGAAPDYAKALALYRDIAKNYPHTQSGAIARYYVGNCLVALGKTDEALKEYQSFAQAYPDQTLLRGLVEQRIGYLYLSAGKKDDAAQAFEAAEKLTGPGLATVELAHLYEAEGKTVKAQEEYKIVLDNLAGTAWGTEAMGKVEQIVPAPKTAAKEEQKPKTK